MDVEKNNIFGVGFGYEYDIRQNVYETNLAKKEDADRGKGILSLEKCTEIGSADAQKQVRTEKENAADAAQEEQATEASLACYRSCLVEGGYIKEGVVKQSPQKGEDPKYDECTKGCDSGYQKAITRCETVTPGSLLNDSLSQVLGSSFRELELADEFNEIFTALVGALATAI